MRFFLPFFSVMFEFQFGPISPAFCESRLPELGVVYETCSMAIMATSSADSSEASYSDTSSGVLNLSCSTSDASHESTDSPIGALEPYLVESHSVSSRDTSEDNDSQDSQRLLLTAWYRNVEFKLVKHKVSYLLQ